MKKPITTEKAVRLIELNNTISFEIDKKDSKDDIKKEVEEMFKVKVESVNTTIQKNKKIAYVKLDKKNLAIDVATKLGVI
ncbi:MAG: 50S ribosomal protein L23 [Candidatus Pacearchaeota archaeon]|jgi:large subunit ribosomal protein L23